MQHGHHKEKIKFKLFSAWYAAKINEIEFEIPNFNILKSISNITMNQFEI